MFLGAIVYEPTKFEKFSFVQVERVEFTTNNAKTVSVILVSFFFANSRLALIAFKLVYLNHIHGLSTNN